MNAIKILAIAVVLGVASYSWAATELIINGGFEAGLDGWTLNNIGQGSSSFMTDDADGFTPLGGLATAGPASGSSYAVSDQTNIGTHAISQIFTVPADHSLDLFFDMFVNSEGGEVIDPIGLDATGSSNQHGRVDILSDGASAFDTGAGVLQNLYIGVDSGTNPNPYTSYSFDLTTLLGDGGTFKLRFAETDNMDYLNMGIDNVSIVVSAVGQEIIPLPAALWMGLSLLGGMGICKNLWHRTNF